MVISRGKEDREEKEWEGGIMLMEGDLTVGGEHIIQYTEDVL